MKKIIIIGTGGACIDILDTINEINLISRKYDCIGFLDDDIECLGKNLHGVEVIGTLNQAMDFNGAYFVNGIGSPHNFLDKKRILEKTNIPFDRFETIIHPTSSISKFSRIGFGTVIFQNVTITSNVKIANHVCILPNSVISHDSIIGDFTIISGSVCVSGNVRVGESCYIGSNCSIKNNISIGDHCLIGIGSNVIKDVADNYVMTGNPAKFLRETNID